jgi:hypothetical protein
VIEINLVPDVKQELIKAQRVRALVISLAFLTGAAAIGIVVVLAGYVFGIQSTREYLSDKTIKEESSKLLAVEDIESTLTIQNQLDVLPSLHENKFINSRIFDVMVAINPPEPYSVTISNLKVDTAENRVSIEAQAVGGFEALEVFKKTILATEVEYSDDEGEHVFQLTESVAEGERNYGQNAEGDRVLQFTLSFTYADELLTPYLKNFRVIGPEQRENVTESYRGIPKTLFAERAQEIEEDD